MGFRGEKFAFDSPGAAVAAMIARLGPPTLPIERVPIALARGRFLAAPTRADRDSPPFDHSAMDGYAVRIADLASNGGPSAETPIRLPVVGEARIGSKPPSLPAGPCAVRIATGAPIPVGAELVVKREDVQEFAGDISAPGAGVGAVILTCDAARRARIGDHIRRRAENGASGEELLTEGAELSAAALGTLAAVGESSPRVFARLEVALITTGDELVDLSATPDAYQIRNSNAIALGGVLESRSWMNARPARHVRDDPGAMSAALRAAVDGADAVILSGGVSMGHRDAVREAVESVGAEVIFHGLPQRPGKPMLGALFAGGRGAVPIFGLPGNPISAMVTCERIVIPVLAARAGLAGERRAGAVPLAAHDGKSLDLWWHRLVRINESGLAELVDGRGSGDIIAAGRSDGFVECPPRDAGGAAAYPFYRWPC